MKNDMFNFQLLTAFGGTPQDAVAIPNVKSMSNVKVQKFDIGILDLIGNWILEI